MALLPTDWSSFAWGALVGGAAAFATGFLKKAGEQAFGLFSNKISPKALEPTQAEGTFVATRFVPGQCAWVNELRLYEYEAKGFTYYPHPKSNARCFRLTSDGRNQLKEFLMVGPNAKEVAGA